nr:endonuclease III domain-containing protein [Caldisericia bacterium]
VDAEIIKELVRPVGFYNQKTARLIDFALYVKNRYGKIEKMLDGETLKVRSELLSLKGIGRETADSILLYAGGHPIFVVDAYTRRLASCIGIDPDQDYDDLRAIFELGLERNPKLFNEYHALIVRLGKEHCRTKPLCEGCPVFPFRK